MTEQSTEIIIVATGAFAGAAFSFLFIRIADALTKIYERQAKHYNALVRLQLVLNFNLNAIFLNRRNITKFSEVLKKTKKENIITINPNKFGKLLLLDKYISDLYYPELINELFQFNINLHKTNQDISVPNETYLNFAKECYQNKEFDTYVHNLQLLVNDMSDLESYLNHLDQKTIELIAKLRVLAKKKPLFTKIMFTIISTKFPKKFTEKVEKEKAVLLQEIEEISTKSEKEKQLIFNR